MPGLLEQLQGLLQQQPGLLNQAMPQMPLVDPTVLGQGARASLNQSLVPLPQGKPTTMEEWAAANPPGRFDPVEAAFALAGGPRGRALIRSGTSVFDFSKPNPEAFHRIANRKLERPLSEIPFEATGKMPETTVISPAELEGKFITPLLGDPTSRGMTISSIDQIPLTKPYQTQGGHGYIRELEGFANAPGAAVTTTNRVRALQEQLGTDVIGAYTKMGPQSGDFSSHTWGVLGRMLPNAEMSGRSKAALNTAIRSEIAGAKPEGASWPKFPGVDAQNLDKHLALAPDSYRKAFIGAIEKARGEIPGVPDVVAVRAATTDPTLINVPTNAAGLSMTKLTGEVRRPSPHTDYQAHLGGEGNFGLGQSLPREVMYPDLVQHFDKTVDPAFWLRKMQMPPADIPYGQMATPRWVSDTSRYMENVGRMGEPAAFEKYLADRFGR